MSVRLDKWLWAVRLYKTRALATDACRLGKITQNGIIAKASKEVKIGDRFELTLECIRRFNINKESPLSHTLTKYKDFFDLFIDFSGYVDFFMLQDFIYDNEKINFSLQFDNFDRPALPQTVDEYKQYKNHTIDLMNSRNKRILESIKTEIK